MPLPGPVRVVFLGCTGGAGQTAVAALTARTLAALRAEPVAVVDLNTGRGSLSEQVGETAADGRPGGIEVVTLRREPGTADGDTPAGGGTTAVGEIPADRGTPAGGRTPAEGDTRADASTAGSGTRAGGDPVSAAELEELIGDRRQLAFLDPAASAVARVLPLADLLVLVAPASADASRAVAMTQEWLDGHGFGGLSSRAVTVVNGVSSRSLTVTEQAEAVARGRCHAIVRVPWDSRLAGPGAAATGPGALRQQTRHAYAALAGVIVGALAVTDGQEKQEEGRAPR
jgi:MinD-like ATPase involved in chromosome partitioning or flagellar assembly